MKRFVIFAAAAMLAMSGVASATNPPNPCGNHGNNCQTQPNGGNGGNGGAGGDATAGAVGLGVGVGIAGAASQSNSNANAGALAGAAVVDSGNSAASVIAPVTNTVGTGVGNFSPESESRSSVGNVSTGASTATNNVGGIGNASGFGSRSLSPEANANNTNLNTDVNTVTTTSLNTLGQQQGQLQGQAVINNVEGSSINVSGSGEGSGQAPFSSSVTVAEGAVQASQTATGGSVAEGAVANSNSNSATVAEGAVANNVDVNVNVEAVDPNATREVTPPIINEIPVASAAPSFSSICSSGAAGQGKSWGVSLAVTNDVCMMLQMADAYMALGDRETAFDFVKKAGAHAKVKGALGYVRHIATLGIL